VSREAWIAIAVVVALIGAVTLYGAIKLAKRLFVTRRLLAQVGGKGGQIAFWAALIYTILPIDILPDPIYLDDMGVLGLALMYMTHLLRKRQAAMPHLPEGRRQRIVRR
jgi:4-amino-4-deoxy-L-arabinose transferase-like glycosyltransferase